MTFVNLTPHTITIRVADTDRAIQPSGRVASVQLRCDDEELYDGVPCLRTRANELTNLPPPQYGIVYLVPFVVAQLAHRRDVVCIDPGPSTERATDGRVLAARWLLRF